VVSAPEVIDLDLTSVETAIELHLMLSDRLAFPDYYGRNWDAFWDCITDPEQSSMPHVLRLSGWLVLNQRMPRDARSLRQLLDDLRAERPEIQVEWC